MGLSLSQHRRPRLVLFLLSLMLCALGVIMIGSDEELHIRVGGGGVTSTRTRTTASIESSHSDISPDDDKPTRETDVRSLPVVRSLHDVAAPLIDAQKEEGSSSNTNLSSLRLAKESETLNNDLSSSQRMPNAGSSVTVVADNDMADAFPLGDVCGRAVLDAVGLVVTVREAKPTQRPDNRDQHAPSKKVFVVETNQPGRDLQLAGRAMSFLNNKTADLVVLSPTVSRLSDSSWSVAFGPCYYDDDEVDRSSGDGASNSEEIRHKKETRSSVVVMDREFSFDILATWLGTKFLGQRWRLPDRNDNPPFAMMKKKCLSLRLEGQCEQYGVTLAQSEGAIHSQSAVVAPRPNTAGATSRNSTVLFPRLRLGCLPRRASAPVCLPPTRNQRVQRNDLPQGTREESVDVARLGEETVVPLFGNGQWRSLPIPENVKAAYNTDGAKREDDVTSRAWAHVKAVLDDPVGLNHFFVRPRSSSSSPLRGAEYLVPHPRVIEDSSDSVESVKGNDLPSLVMAWEPPCRREVEEISRYDTKKVSPSARGQWLGRLTAADVARAMHRYFGRGRGTSGQPLLYTIALFGDSMMVEQFHVWCHMLYGEDFARHVRQGKTHNLRWMNVEKTFELADESRVEEGERRETLVTLRVRFARSYTTKGGHSVIAPVATIVRQLLSVDPDVVAGNLASLHWQQNMRSLADWEANLKAFGAAVGIGEAPNGALLRYKTHKTHDDMKADARPERLFYYWGNTMIQMGRTQGLNSGRTKAFNDAARRLLSPLLFTKNASSLDGPHSVVNDPSSQQGSSPVTYFDPYHLSVARRESSFDGQHWACYHRYGGVSASITQLWMALLVHTGARDPRMK